MDEEELLESKNPFIPGSPVHTAWNLGVLQGIEERDRLREIIKDLQIQLNAV